MLPYAFMSLFFVIGFGLLTWGIISARRSLAVGAWPVAPGVIDTCEIVTKSGGSDGGTTYEVKVSYTYSVNQKKYTGSRVAFGYGGSDDSPTQQQLYKKLNESKSIEVRYDPHDPANSSLSYGMHKTLYFLFIFSITWLAFTAGMTLLLWVGTRPDIRLIENIIAR